MGPLKNIKYYLLIIMFMAVSITYADEYKKNQFAITIPSGWVEMPRDIIDSYEKLLAEAAPDLPLQHYDYGFQLESSENWFEYPYILIQIKNSGRIPENDLEKLEQISLQKEFDKHEKQVGSIASELQAGKMVFDKHHRIVWMGFEMKVVNVGPISGLSAMIPTEKGLIQVSGYSLRADYPIYDSIFHSIALSTIPIAELAYKPHWTDNVPSVVRGINWDKVIGNTIIGALIGGILGLFSYLKRKKNS